MKISKWILLFVCLGFLFLISYSPHFSYRFPIHNDEYAHIAVTRVFDSYVSEGLFRDMILHVLHNPIEKGFSLFLWILSWFFNIVLVHKFLPSLNLLLVGGILFYFMNKKFGFWFGLFSVLFLGSLKSNVNILGFWFFVPIMFVFGFIYLFLFRLDSLNRNSKSRDYILLVLLLFVIAFIHSSSFLVMFLVFLIWCLFNFKFIKEGWKKFSWFLVLLIPIITFSYAFLQRGVLSFLNRFIWGSGIVQINYNPFLLFGLVSSLFLIWGYYLCFRKKELLVFRIYILIPLIGIVFFWIFNFSIFSSYQRYLYHFMIASVPLASIGFYDVIKRVFDFIKKYSRNIACIVVITLIIISFAVFYWNYFSIDDNVKLYRLIDEQDYDAMIFLGNYSSALFNPDKPRMAEVISPIFPGGAMHAVSGKAGFSGLFTFADVRNQASIDFFGYDCDGKKDFLGYYTQFTNLRYVYSYEAINCDFLDEIYKNEKVWIYQVDLD